MNGCVGQSLLVQHAVVAMHEFVAEQYFVPGPQMQLPPGPEHVVFGADAAQSVLVQHVPFAMHVFDAEQ